MLKDVGFWLSPKNEFDLHPDMSDISVDVEVVFCCENGWILLPAISALGMG